MPKLSKDVSDARAQRKQLAESDFEEYIKLVQPKRWLAAIHKEAIAWITSDQASDHQLLLLPRDHMKSAIAGLWATWQITKDPAIKILYISSTSNLAKKQLKFIKDILTSDIYSMYWPDMVNRKEANREKWTETEISIDHPRRKEEYVRDPTVFTAGMTTNIVGMHSDIQILDDVVEHGNVYTEEGREKVREAFGYLSSIAGTTSRVLVVGTRYHPSDLYNDLMQMEIEDYDDDGQLVASIPLFQVMERPVENAGDGSGEFLWPRQKAPDGKWYGFDFKILNIKRNLYTNKSHYRAQYYNDPHDADSSPIKNFQYYDSGFLAQKGGHWYFKGNRLNVFAAIDFAFSLSKKADASCIVVVGVDGDNNYYVLDIDRFKTDKHSEYYSHIFRTFNKWGFRKIRAEVSVAQVVIVKDLKENYIKKNGLGLSVEEFRPNKWQGAKEERIMAVLEPKYANGQVWHYRGGNSQLLEEELISANPAHDDIKDALASAIDCSIAPTNFYRMQKDAQANFIFHSKFGGVA
jgi:hypothetical protein